MSTAEAEADVERAAAAAALAAAIGGDLHDPTLADLVEEARQMNALVAAFEAQVPPFDTPEGLAQLREAGGLFSAGTAEGVVETTIPGPAGPIPARVHEPDLPDGGPAAAVVLELHGGGWSIGSAASDDLGHARLAREVGVVVVAIDYRLAPEHPFPAGPDDAFAAAEWLLAEASGRWGTDRLVLAGGSAGAHLAALTALRLRDEHGPDVLRRIAGLNLVFGPYDLGMTPSQRGSDDALVIPRSIIETIYGYFLPGRDAEARRDPSISPLYADLTGLPPALLTVGTLDPLLDDSLFFAARLRQAGTEATLAVYPEAIHGFPSFPTAMARHARALMHAWIADVAARPPRG